MFQSREAIEIHRKIRMRKAQEEWDIWCYEYILKLAEELRNLKPLDPSYWSHTFNPGSSSGNYVPKEVSALHQRLQARHLSISKEQK